MRRPWSGRVLERECIQTEGSSPFQRRRSFLNSINFCSIQSKRYKMTNMHTLPCQNTFFFVLPNEQGWLGSTVSSKRSSNGFCFFGQLVKFHQISTWRIWFQPMQRNFHGKKMALICHILEKKKKVPDCQIFIISSRM